MKIFWFHYNKPMSKKAGKPQLTLHYNNTCYIVDSINVNVPTYSYNRSRQPHCVIKGKCNKVCIQGNKAIIL
jgi:hypothetical protein